MPSSSCIFNQVNGLLIPGGVRSTSNAGPKATCQKDPNCRAWDTAGNIYSNIDSGTYYPTRPYTMNIKAAAGCNIVGISTTIPTPKCGWFMYPNSKVSMDIRGKSLTPKDTCAADLDCKGYNQTTNELYGYNMGLPVSGGTDMIFMKNFKNCKP